MTSNKYVLKSLQYIYIPGFNSYCLSINLLNSTVGFSVNGVLQVASIYIKELNYANALLLSSKVLVYNEMFSLVNIYDTDLATAVSASNAPGQLLAWNVSDWTLTNTPAYQAHGPIL